MEFLKRAGALLVMVTCVSAAAKPPKPRIALHPLVIEDAIKPEERKQIVEGFDASVRAREVCEAPAASAVASALEARGRTSCVDDDNCLMTLAAATGSPYALLVRMQLNLNKTGFEIRARVVRADGATVLQTDIWSKARPEGISLTKAAELVLNEFIATLKLEDLPPALPATRPGETHEPDLMARSESVAPGRMTAYVVGGAAVVGLVIAAVSGGAALSAKGSLPADGHLGSDQLNTQLAVNRNATISAVAGGIGGAAAVIAIVMFATSSSSVAAAPLPGGGGLVTVGGTF